MVITEYGIADLRGASLSQRLNRLSTIAHSDFRDDLLQGEPRTARRPAMEASRA